MTCRSTPPMTLSIIAAAKPFVFLGKNSYIHEMDKAEQSYYSPVPNGWTAVRRVVSAPNVVNLRSPSAVHQIEKIIYWQHKETLLTISLFRYVGTAEFIIQGTDGKPMLNSKGMVRHFATATAAAKAANKIIALYSCRKTPSARPQNRIGC